MYRMNQELLGPLCLLLACGVAMGCSDDTEMSTDMTVAKDGGAGDTGGLDNRLVRDKAKVCPTSYKTTAPREGLNAGFLVESLKRTFYLRLPDSKKFPGPRPMMVYFHGTGGSALEINLYRKSWADVLIKNGFIVAGPQGELNGTMWPEWDAMRAANDKTRKNKDLLFFDTLVDCVAGHHKVDANRIYVSGLSAGGIMSNRVLRERSKLLAGGVVGSGVLEFTEPISTAPLSPLAVMVTWGGDNDEYAGSSGGKQVAKINFVQQAAMASKLYEENPGGDQIHCRGHDVGHRWLNVVEDVMVDYLLAHPLGNTKNTSWKLKPLASNIKVTCSEDAAKFVPKVTVTCKKNTLDDCQVYCQNIADCVVENASVAPILSNEITALGFTGTNFAECSGCVKSCEADVTAGGSVDTTMLACYKAEVASMTCGQGLAAAIKVADVVNKCCANQTKSKVCGRFCTTVMKNSVAASFFSACTPWK